MSPIARFDVPLEGFVEELCQLIDLEKNRDPASPESIQKAKRIGQDLYSLGGFNMMREVMNMVIKERPIGYELVNFWWNGIGEWRY